MSSTHVLLRNLSVARAGTPLVANLTLAVSAGQCAVIVGENGRGKSSLLAAITGSLMPSSGTVSVQGSVAIAHQHMPAGALTVGDLTDQATSQSLEALRLLDQAAQMLVDDAPDAESAYAAALARAEQLDAWNAEQRVDQALEALGALTDRARRLSDMSVGQRYRVRLACLLGSEHDILVLDEPTNHLDHHALDFLTTSIKARTGVVILVTHDRALIRDVADVIVDLDPTPDGEPRIHGDGFDAYLDRRRAMIERWKQGYRAEQDKRSALSAELQQAQARVDAAWRPPKGTGKHTRASRAPGVVQALKRARQALEQAPVLTPKPPLELEFPKLSARTGQVLATVSPVSVPGHLHFSEDLEIKSGDRIVVTGPNGAGKTTLLSVLAEALAPTEGRVRLNARVGWLRQESGDVEPDRQAAVRFGLLDAQTAAQKGSEMSMGQRRRLDLASVLAQDPQLLLLDEPTNHLSMHLTNQLTEALQVTRAAVVIVTHDRQLLRDMRGWRHIHLKPDSGADLFPGVGATS